MDRIGHRNEGAGRRVGCRMDPQLDYASSACTLNGLRSPFQALLPSKLSNFILNKDSVDSKQHIISLSVFHRLRCQYSV